jgi:VWFA-related protein
VKRTIGALTCVALLAVAPAAQQLPPVDRPAFRTGVDAVQIDVSVLDEKRRPVRGLTAADFTVLVDGWPQALAAFSAIELPAPPAAPPSGAAAVPADVARNDLPAGRIVVILIDPFMERVMVPGRVTIADPPGRAAATATALRMIDSLGPGDLTAVVHTIYGVSQNLTTDKARLRRAVESTSMGTIRRAEGEPWGSCYCGTCRVDAITRLATALRGEPQRRKVVFFVGERLRLAPVTDGCNGDLEPATMRMLHAAQLANVTVHTVDPNSLETTNVRAGDDFKPEGRPISEAAAEQERANRAHLVERQQSLQTVADWTGGRAIMNTNAPQDSVGPILDESSAYYLLAFQPDVKPDGRFHSIAVKVNRPGVSVRTRSGYYAEPAPPAVASGQVDVLDAVSRSLLPERGLPLSVTAAPFRGADGAPVVVVTTGVRADATLRGPGNVPAGPAPQFEPIEILTTAFRDGERALEWQRQRLSIALPETAPNELRYESISTLRLKPGSYEVRVATRHERAGVLGSVHTYVDVPDFESDPVTLSGIVLLDRRAPTATPPEALGGVLATAPTTRRDFTTADRASALVRVYQPQGRPPAAVSLVFRVLDGQLRKVATAAHTLAADQFAPAGSADGRFELPLDTLPPGSYVLRVDAAGGRTTGRREVPFTVR